MWLPLPTAQGYKGQALRVLNKTFFNTLILYPLSLNILTQKTFTQKP